MNDLETLASGNPEKILWHGQAAILANLFFYEFIQ
jgi:hypothetical protein